MVKEATTNGHAANGRANGDANGHANGSANGYGTINGEGRNFDGVYHKAPASRNDRDYWVSREDVSLLNG